MKRKATATVSKAPVNYSPPPSPKPKTKKKGQASITTWAVLDSEKMKPKQTKRVVDIPDEVIELSSEREETDDSENTHAISSTAIVIEDDPENIMNFCRRQHFWHPFRNNVCHLLQKVTQLEYQGPKCPYSNLFDTL